ncbi:MAG: excinuclease ABC subunit UvrC [Nitrospirota bacterium]
MDRDKILKDLPNLPGIYIMKDKNGDIIYVGKAKSLSDRVRTYFQKSASLTQKTISMIERVEHIDFMVTKSELEALILENNLIKKHRPKYNVVLRDDKNYPYLRFQINDDFPRLEIVRRVKNDRALYFGPYVPTNALRETLRFINKVFPLATCRIKINEKRDRPCIQYQIKKCKAPCTGNQTKKEYQKIVKDVRMFLEGKDRELLKSLRIKMGFEAERLNFEEAARIRDRIRKIEKVLERQIITLTDFLDRDIIAIGMEGNEAVLQVLFVRRGMLTGKKEIFMEDIQERREEEIYRLFIQQFYSNGVIIPEEIIFPLQPIEKDLLEQWLLEKKGKKVFILSPNRGKRNHLVRLAIENARAALKTKIGERKRGEEILNEIKELLRLKKIPNKIEAFDISNIMGNYAVGSMVVWEKSMLRKNEYRRFRIKTIDKANDFGMLQEIIYRRYSMVKKSGNKFPDLVLIDGGKGQLNASIEIIEGLKIEDIEIVALAKARDNKKERVYVKGQDTPIVLSSISPASHLIQQIRDESHRFAITYYRKVHKKELISSVLDDIQGIGKKKKLSLLTHFKGLEGIKEASSSEIQKVLRVNRDIAERILESVRND